MAVKFAIGNVIEVPVRFQTNDGGKALKVSFKLICERLEEDELKNRIEQPDHTVKEFMQSVATGWKEQTFLVEETTGKGAEFSAENFKTMMSFPGLANLAFTSYLKEQAANVKN